MQIFDFLILDSRSMIKIREEKVKYLLKIHSNFMLMEDNSQIILKFLNRKSDTQWDFAN